MTAKPKPGYDTDVVFAFFTAIGEQRDDGRFTHLNEERIRDGHREMLERWRQKEQVSLLKLDEFLVQYDLMLFELEHWAIANCGWDGFIDPFAQTDSEELVA